jgi:chromosome segregation ATPase
MEKITAKVVTIESELQNSNRLLQTLENKAKKSIGREVSQMSNALVSSDHRIQHVSSEMQSFLKAIEYSDQKPSSVDLSPQMNWLSSNLALIAGDFQTAESRADSALNHCTAYHYQVKDVGQDVETQKTKLDSAQQEGERLTSEVQEKLSSSQLLMEQTQSRIRDKENEIKAKTQRVSSLRSQKETMEATIRTKQAEISRANAKAERKKDKGAALGFVSTPSWT